MFKKSIAFLTAVFIFTANFTYAKSKILQKEMKSIYFILQNTNEYHSHNMGGANNKVLLHKDGQMVIVLDKDGNILDKNDINYGTYNFASAAEEPLNHFLYDIDPWIKLGRTPNDSSTVEMRLKAFLLDLKDGIRKAYINKKRIKNIKLTKEDKDSTTFLFFQRVNIDSLFFSKILDAKPIDFEANLEIQIQILEEKLMKFYNIKSTNDSNKNIF